MGKIGDSVRMIVDAVEKKTGLLFDDMEIAAIFQHTMRKIEVNGAGDGALSLVLAIAFAVMLPR